MTDSKHYSMKLHHTIQVSRVENDVNLNCVMNEINLWLLFIPVGEIKKQMISTQKTHR
jgi:hypothetical protein